MKRPRVSPVPRPSSPPVAQPSSPSVVVRSVTLALLAAVTLAAFAGVLRNQWTFTDDPAYIFENPHVNRGLTIDGAVWALRGPHGGNWHPLTSLAHMANVSLFGLRPAGHHAVSLILHALNAVLLVFVCFAYTRAWWRSLLVAALFALHPLRVESVAWAAELKDVLSAALFLLALLAYRRWVARPGAGRYAALLVTFALALMAKPMAVSLPVILLALDGWPLRRLGGQLRRRVLEKWPLFAMALADTLITLAVQRRVGAMSSLDAHGLGPRFANAAVSVWRYLGKTAWPSGLAIFYPDRPVSPMAAVLATAGLAAVTFLVFWWRRTRPYLATGWLWYLVVLLPVLGIVQVGGQACADRYTYLATVGILVMIVWAGADAVASRPLLRGVAIVLALASLTALGGVTLRQVSRWRDTRTLYEHALAVTPDNAVAECSLGAALSDAGEFPAAIIHLETALRLAPGYSYAEAGLGRALLLAGRPTEAIHHLERSVVTLESASAHDFLGSAYAGVGRLGDAVREYEAALRLDPDGEPALVHLGQAFGALGRYSEAEAVLARAVDLAHENVERRRLLAMALLFDGKVSEAVAQYERILEARPGDLDALIRMAWTRATYPDARYRNGQEALRYAEKARGTSGVPRALVESVFGAACAEAGRFPEAELSAERALRMAQQAKDSAAVARYAGQLREYRARRPFRAEP
jgi:protein O-mannosyl-transferase